MKLQLNDHFSPFPS